MHGMHSQFFSKISPEYFQPQAKGSHNQRGTNLYVSQKTNTIKDSRF